MADEKKDTSGFDLSNDDEQSIDDIIEETKSDDKSKDGDDDVISGDKRSRRRKAILVGSISGVVAVLVVAAVVLFNPFGNSGFFGGSGDDKGSGVGQDSGKYVPPFANGNDEYSSENDPIPFKTDEWQQGSFTDKNKDAETLKKDALKSDSGSALDISSGTLPSEESGFTSDLNQSEDANGSINPMFSYWTKESFESETRIILERFLNPTFGGWEKFQWSDSNAGSAFDPRIFSDIFTTRYMSSSSGKPLSEWIPVFADWNSNDYGMNDVLLAGGTRWFGQVDSSTSDFQYDDANRQYKVVLTANVKFTAWTKDQKKVEKTGVLILNLVSNANQLNDSDNRVLVDGATLRVD